MKSLKSALLLLSLLISIFITEYLIGKFGEMYKREIDILNLSKINTDCRFFGGNHSQNMACLRNLETGIGLENELLSILNTQCKNGNGESCILFSDFTILYQNSGVIRSPIWDIEKIRDNCLLTNFDKGKMTDTSQRITNCALFEKISTIFKSTASQSLAIQENCWLDFNKCSKTTSKNILFSQDENKRLFTAYCENYKRISSSHQEYCDSLNLKIQAQISFFDIFKAKDRHYELVSKFCLNNKDDCDALFNQPIIIKNLMTIDEKFNFSFFDNFLLDYSSEELIAEETKPGSISNLNSIKHQFLRRKLLNKINGNLDKDCAESANKIGCAFSVGTVNEAYKKKEQLVSYCEAGDNLSCDYLKILENSKKIKLDPSKSIYNYYYAWESVVAENLIQDSKMLNFTRFLNTYKFSILIHILVIIVIFIFYIFIIFIKLDDFLKFVAAQSNANKETSNQLDFFKNIVEHYKKKKIDEMKNKINKKL